MGQVLLLIIQKVESELICSGCIDSVEWISANWNLLHNCHQHKYHPTFRHCATNLSEEALKYTNLVFHNFTGK